MLLPDLRLDISLFSNAWDPRPRAKTVKLDALVRALTTFRERIGLVDKRGLPAWSPARFQGERREASEVSAVSCLVLDLDGAHPELVRSAWSDVFHVVHSTWSHTGVEARFRLIVPLARPVPADRWREAWDWAADRSPEADGSCKDPGRLYFLPAVREADQVRFSWTHEAPLLDLLDELPAAQEDSPCLPAPRRRVPRRLRDFVARRRLERDPGARERVADAVGARLAGVGGERRAEDAPCPRCGRRSVWFWLAPRSLRWACCQHRRSCGWTGPLEELLVGKGAS